MNQRQMGVLNIRKEMASSPQPQPQPPQKCSDPFYTRSAIWQQPRFMCAFSAWARVCFIHIRLNWCCWVRVWPLIWVVFHFDSFSFKTCDSMWSLNVRVRVRVRAYLSLSDEPPHRRTHCACQNSQFHITDFSYLCYRLTQPYEHTHNPMSSLSRCI